MERAGKDVKVPQSYDLHKATNNKYALITNIKQRPVLYFMAIPIILYYIVFHYIPMFGIMISFQNYLPAKGFLSSQWVGMNNFIRFFSSIHFGRVVKNTFMLSFYDLLFGFPAPILFALLLNEVKNPKFKRITQTITYIPHFVSLIVICGLIFTFTKRNSPIAELVATFTGGNAENLLANPKYFRPVYIISGIWQGFGWGSIIYFAAISNVSPELYEAAIIDGAGRFKQAVYVTLPSIAPTIIIMLILRIGALMSVGHEKIILLYSPITYEVSDVISSYTYRAGLLEMNYSYGTAVGLFNSIINFILVLGANWLSRRVTETSLW